MTTLFSIQLNNSLMKTIKAKLQSILTLKVKIRIQIELKKNNQM